MEIIDPHLHQEHTADSIQRNSTTTPLSQKIAKKNGASKPLLISIKTVSEWPKIDQLRNEI